MADPLLLVDRINVAYGAVQILWELTLGVRRGEVCVLLGANGAGKTTILKTVSGLLRPSAGTITFDGRALATLPAYEIADLGIAHVPEGRKVFPLLTVFENLQIGAYGRRGRAQMSETVERVYDLFPILQERRRQLAGTLSGGQQQMLAIGRGLMSCPDLLMLDEPSQGLMPKNVDALFDAIARISAAGTTVLLVEQNVHQAQHIGTRFVVIRHGRAVLEGGRAMLDDDAMFREAYLGM